MESKDCALESKDCVLENFERFAKEAGNCIERSKAYEKEVNLLRDEVIAKQNKINELQMKLSTLEMKENNIYDVNDTVCVKDVERVSMLETENAKIESELLCVKYENIRLKSENENMKRALTLNKSLYERELQKNRQDSLW